MSRAQVQGQLQPLLEKTKTKGPPTVDLPVPVPVDRAETLTATLLMPPPSCSASSTMLPTRHPPAFLMTTQDSKCPQPRRSWET